MVEPERPQKIWLMRVACWIGKGKNTHTAERSGAERSGQQLVIEFVETKRSICFHELNHKLLAAPLYMCFYPKATRTKARVCALTPTTHACAHTYTDICNFYCFSTATIVS